MNLSARIILIGFATLIGLVIVAKAHGQEPIDPSYVSDVTIQDPKIIIRPEDLSGPDEIPIRQRYNSNRSKNKDRSQSVPLQDQFEGCLILVVPRVGGGAACRFPFAKPERRKNEQD